MHINFILFYVTAVSYCIVFSKTPKLTQFVDLHNDGRLRVQKGEVPGHPCARYMPPVEWDEELARKAQEWANKCKAEHNSNENRRTSKFRVVGQNLAMGYDLQAAYEAWFAEYKEYNYATRECVGMCGHYTQAVWNETTHIGCGYAECPSQRWRHIFVCNYGPAGNMRLRTLTGEIVVLPPYEASDTCPGKLNEPVRKS
ncbi:SCP-like protein [Opisthorchis viverrini]|uniref:SCP-like protein n=1 Tax=Opisthorchis viverrini TaxID=6198 RepID=A0A1S8WP99_OPIVI|nr:SCP-like protein [Opisthorchis viverrini]